MTGARAVTQLADRVQHIGILVLLVRPGLEVSCVTSGTVGLERRIAPGDLFRVVLMTGGTWKIAGVIQRLIGQSHVPVIMREPRNRIVTDVAFLLSDEVTGVLAGRNDAVMTGGA